MSRRIIHDARRLERSNLARYFARKGRTTEALETLGPPETFRWRQGKYEGRGMLELIDILGVAPIEATKPFSFRTLWDWRAALTFAGRCLDDALKDVFACGAVPLSWPGYRTSLGVVGSALSVAQGFAPISSLSDWLPEILTLKKEDVTHLLLVAAMRELSQAAHDARMPGEVARYCRLVHKAGRRQALHHIGATYDNQLNVLAHALGYRDAQDNIVETSATAAVVR